MTNSNRYDGIVEAWKIELIVSRAQRLGIRRHDLEDAQQEIVLDVLSFRFDEAKSNGACERTVLTSVIDRRLMTIARTKKRYEKHVGPMPAEMWNDGEREPFTEPIKQQSLEMDMRDAIGAMSDEEQAVCAALATGESIAEIARQLGRSWHAANTIVARIRWHFEQLGLDAWIEQ